MWVKGEIFRDLADAAGNARDSLDRAGQPSLFDRFDWFERTMAHCAPAPYPLIARARAEGSDGWLFLSEDGAGKARAMASRHSLTYGPVFTGEPEEKTQGALMTAIARRISKHLSTIQLAPMTQAHCTLMARAFGRAGWKSSIVEREGSWTIDVSHQTFADYWVRRPSALRSTVQNDDASAKTIVTIEDSFDSQSWVDFEAICAESWEFDEGTRAFLRATAVYEGSAGTLRLGIARIDGEPVAAQLWTIENGIAIIHKVAHRHDVAEHSPHNVLSAAMFERAIDVDKVDRINLGSGDGDWMDDRVPLFALSLFNMRKPAGLLGAAKAKAAALVAGVRSR